LTNFFVDEVFVNFVAGKGGDGLVAFLREKFRPKGGPSGGDGGNGGSIILVSDENEDTLTDFLRKKEFKAPDGENGKRRKQRGKDGEDLLLKVPVGTQVFDVESEKIIFDFKESGVSFVVAKGGRGGFGNGHFASSTRQVPDFAEAGEEGEKRFVKLTLKLIADCGIIGLPNTGKSTLISRISSAKPKIADYPFTTLVPNLGVVEMFGKKLVFADVPGLIPGAHKGKGLGIKFLKHVERCSALIHLIDGTSQNIYQDYVAIENELKLFSKEVYKKPRIIAINKCDVINPDIPKEFGKKKVLKISAVSGCGIEKLLKEVFKINEKVEKKYNANKEIESEKDLQNNENIPNLTQEDRTIAKRIENGKFLITGERIEGFAKRTQWENEGAYNRFRNILKRIGIEKKLKKLGIKDGDSVFVGEKNSIVFIWRE